MKKSILVLLVFLTILSGCSLIFPEVENSSQSQDGPSNDYLSEYSDKWCYQRLPATLKSGYGEIYAAVVEGFDNDSTITISDSTLGTQREYTGIRIELSKPLETREDAKLLYTAFLWDNPRFFHIGNTYSYEGYRSGNNDYYNVFCLVYTMSAQQRMVAAGRLKYVVSQIKKDLANAQPSDQFETELFCMISLPRSVAMKPAPLNPTTPQYYILQHLLHMAHLLKDARFARVTHAQCSFCFMKTAWSAPLSTAMIITVLPICGTLSR